jgi:multiple sugar transport system substrate-binding protein
VTDQGSAEGGIGWRTVVVAVAVAIGVTLGMLWFSDTESTKGSNGGPDKPTEDAMSELIFAVWGSDQEIAAYEDVVADYNKESVVVDVRVVGYDDADAMLDALRSGTITPDLYLLPREDLAETVAEGRNRPLLDLLDARGVALGDDVSRDAISAFATGDDLQCMPYTISPMVLYYNTELIDFDRMEARGLDVPSEDRGEWSSDEMGELFKVLIVGKGVVAEPAIERADRSHKL